MQLTVVTPKKSINKAYLREKVARHDIERFKQQIISLFEKTEATYSEDTLKDFVTEFLRKTWYDPANALSINKERKDLAIHTGKLPKDPVAVITEVKRISSPEMISAAKINVKAFHELVLYYLEERHTAGNIEMKHLVATNVYEWFLFDANEFDKKIFRNSRIKRLFEIYKSDKKDNTYFYDELKKIIGETEDAVACTSFDLRTIQKEVQNRDKADDNRLIPFYKILSPEHLLKKPFANDSNTLDKKFYDELLYIIGLEEKKDGSKKLIDRRVEDKRNPASLLENAIGKLRSRDCLLDVPNLQRYGETDERQYYNLALELCITWVNRILFLKLLEAQLFSYHKQDSVLFLNTGLLFDYDELNNLFFQVLAEKLEARDGNLKEKFAHVPYLNSSLFERTRLERITIDIGALDNRHSLPLFDNTVMKDAAGKKLTGSLPSLEYLFRFLDAYDFTSEGKAEIQEENKSLINASVLGLIFEKINGYKDGSFFTPGFITMYMCRETIRKAVVQKFNEVKGWQVSSFDELYNKIDDRSEANNIINSLTICDPAVGSGHFLVSALNELLSIKSDLKILQDRKGKRLKEYTVEVENDELVVTDEDGEPFQYKPGHPESQRVQETLFHEKEGLIEDCLFGVDINANSVKICRLRLWIELLKNAYYTNESGYKALETLPNIDINIKEGNSLISRFSLDADVSGALKQSKWSIESYKQAVRRYKDAQGKKEKRELEELINAIKNDFRKEINVYDPIRKKLSKKRGDFFNLTQTKEMFAVETKVDKKTAKQIETLNKDITDLENQIKEAENNKIYENAFEWRFEFPEVLNNEGSFIGFDVVIGNPPYIRHEKIKWMKPFLQKSYQTFSGTADLFIYFVERGLSVTKQGGQFIFILPSKWMKSEYGEPLRKWVKQFKQEKIVDFGDLPVFEEATTYPCIWQIKKTDAEYRIFPATIITELDFPHGLKKYVDENSFEIEIASLPASGWSLLNFEQNCLMERLQTNSITLGEYVNYKLFRGVLTGYNKAFVLSQVEKDDLLAEDPTSSEIIKPFLAGKDIDRYSKPTSSKYLLFTRRGIDIEKHPGVLRHLEQYKERLQPKPKNWEGNEWGGRKEGNYKWYELQDAIDYYEEFEQPKIVYQEIAAYSTFAFDDLGIYPNNKLFFIPTGSKNLLGLLNSKLCWFWLKKKANVLRGALALQSSYVFSIPIKETVLNSKDLRLLVENILNVKADNPNAQTDELERQVDEVIFELYGLTHEERAIIQNAI